MSPNPVATDIARLHDGEKSSQVPARAFKRIYDPDELDDVHGAERPNSRRVTTLERMHDRGPQRELSQVTAAMLNNLADLAIDQPNCAGVIDYIRQQLALSRLAVLPTLRWLPILLEGPSGVGKSHFAQALARLLDNALTIINCSTVTASFVLAGNNPSWQDSRPGCIQTPSKGAASPTRLSCSTSSISWVAIHDLMAMARCISYWRNGPRGASSMSTWACRSTRPISSGSLPPMIRACCPQPYVVDSTRYL